jgi:hypothetical protein
MTITDAAPFSTKPDSANASADAVPTIDLTERAEPTAARPTFTITDAAAACAVSRKTITRKLGDLALHGAAKDDDGIWRIPVEALLAVGLHPGRSLPGQGTRPAAPPSPQVLVQSPAQPALADPSVEVVTVPRQRWDDLRIRLAKAEAEAAERALALADARLALRALTAGPSRVADAAAPAPREEPPAAAQPVAAAVAGTAAPIALEAAAPHAEQPATQAPSSAVPTSQEAPDPAAQLAAARSHAAQNGGYVPAAPAAPPRERRWWQSK